MTPSTALTLKPGDRYAQAAHSTTWHIVEAGADRGPEGYQEQDAKPICKGQMGRSRGMCEIFPVGLPSYRIFVCSKCASRRPFREARS